MGDSISKSISGDSLSDETLNWAPWRFSWGNRINLHLGLQFSISSYPLDETLNQGPPALLLRGQYEFPFEIKIVQFSFYFFSFFFLPANSCSFRSDLTQTSLYLISIPIYHLSYDASSLKLTLLLIPGRPGCIRSRLRQGRDSACGTGGDGRGSAPDLKFPSHCSAGDGQI